MLAIPALFLIFMYVFMIRPQKKQERKLQDLRNNMQVGDNVVTIGGIIGRIVNIKDKEVTISTSVAGTMMTFRKEAINQVVKAQKENETETSK
ncbi:hypothetical protein HMPREF1632_02050 [Mageeibacillus indolicus 0009-5]|nr:hypothetical protein HMPREF1632_02050 [Mageeibacillus indolicus 0009-5]